MMNKIITHHKLWNKLALSFVIMVLILQACKKADDFYDKLQALPQIDNTNNFAYKPAYIVGDTMVITGKLYPDKNLQITVGGTTTTIVKTGKIKDGFANMLDQVSIIITGGMAGKGKEVKITSGDYSTLGASIDVYTPGGVGSFDRELKSVRLKTFNNGSQNIFLHCQNGKGDVYYYSAINKDLRHVNKNGEETIIYDLSGALFSGGAVITSFQAGGVDPNGENLYFSAGTSRADYVFVKIDLNSKQLTVLNQSQTIAAPYEGSVNTVKMIISGIYPDSKGNVYLGIGINDGSNGSTLPDAIARYNKADNGIRYLFKNLIYGGTSYPGMPGTNIPFTNTAIKLRFSPDEKLMYVMEESFRDFSAVIEVYDLDARVKLNDFATSDVTGTGSRFNVIGPFSSLQFNMGSGRDINQTFGYLPLPGKRLQVLLFQAGANKFGFPKWVVFDFTEQRTYAYAPGTFDQNSGAYAFRDGDELLNYDGEGNLYATSNGKSYLLKTQEQ
ncbi:MAG TPA: hypothetical protein ENO28_17245 [Bacteroidetes bacterium]|nr:hypothetical protein [Bacteroidota bacterium]